MRRHLRVFSQKAHKKSAIFKYDLSPIFNFFALNFMSVFGQNFAIYLFISSVEEDVVSPIYP